MRTLYLDCGMGAAGDMLTAALLELLPRPDEFVKRLNGLGIPGVTYRLEQAEKCGISNTVLAAALRELERDGLVRRQAYPEVPVRVEYSPTECCLRLLPVLESLSDWAEAEMGSGEGELPE